VVRYAPWAATRVGEFSLDPMAVEALTGGAQGSVAHLDIDAGPAITPRRNV
jgi:hypothetical protein